LEDSITKYVSSTAPTLHGNELQTLLKVKPCCGLCRRCDGRPSKGVGIHIPQGAAATPARTVNTQDSSPVRNHIRV